MHATQLLIRFLECQLSTHVYTIRLIICKRFLILIIVQICLKLFEESVFSVFEKITFLYGISYYIWAGGTLIKIQNNFVHSLDLILHNFACTNCTAQYLYDMVQNILSAMCIVLFKFLFWNLNCFQRKVSSLLPTLIFFIWFKYRYVDHFSPPP